MSAAKTANSGFRIADYPMYLMATVRQRNFVNMSHALRRYGVTPQIWRVLAILDERDGHNIAYLSEMAVVERSNMSRIVDNMERSGLVRRGHPEADKRHRLVFLTEAGQAKFDEILPAALGQYRKGLEGFSASEVETLMRLLRRLKDNVYRSP